MEVVGFGWFGSEKRYRRLPTHPAYKISRELDEIADRTAGGQVHFKTDSRQVWVRVELTKPSALRHMAATGQSGFDLYYGPPGKLVFSGASNAEGSRTRYTSLLFDSSQAEMRNMVLDFPLYNGVRKVEIGLEKSSRLEPPDAPESRKTIVVYGTSITEGGVASRPGMAWTNILSRRLDRRFINLGFSGHGRGEPELAQLISELPDKELIILDYEANAPSPILEDTLGPFIKILRSRAPQVKILVLSRTPYTADLLKPVSPSSSERRAFQEGLVRSLREAGDHRIYFYDGSQLYGTAADWSECTVDGAHPNDLGFMRIAEHLEPEVRRILREP
jgi:lysophospholipase L1-like esterase